MLTSETMGCATARRAHTTFQQIIIADSHIVHSLHLVMPRQTESFGLTNLRIWIIRPTHLAWQQVLMDSKLQPNAHLATERAQKSVTCKGAFDRRAIMITLISLLALCLQLQRLCAAFLGIHLPSPPIKIVFLHRRM